MWSSCVAHTSEERCSKQKVHLCTENLKHSVSTGHLHCAAWNWTKPVCLEVGQNLPCFVWTQVFEWNHLHFLIWCKLTAITPQFNLIKLNLSNVNNFKPVTMVEKYSHMPLGAPGCRGPMVWAFPPPGIMRLGMDWPKEAGIKCQNHR